MSNRGIEFSNQDDYEEHKLVTDNELEICKMKENLIWLGEIYYKLHSELEYKRVIGKGLDDMYLGELYDYMDGYRESIINELRDIYNGLIVLREYCNKCMSNLPSGLERLIIKIERVL